MSGYLRQPVESEAALRGGWFRAGDMAWADDEGYLYLAGRKNDMIIRGGENVYPIEIETVLADYPGVGEVAVIGLPDDEWGESVCAVLVMAAGHAEPAAAELRAHCRSRLAAYKVPTRFEFRPGLPVNVERQGAQDRAPADHWLARWRPRDGALLMTWKTTESGRGDGLAAAARTSLPGRGAPVAGRRRSATRSPADAPQWIGRRRRQRRAGIRGPGPGLASPPPRRGLGRRQLADRVRGPGGHPHAGADPARGIGRVSAPRRAPYSTWGRPWWARR